MLVLFAIFLDRIYVCGLMFKVCVNLIWGLGFACVSLVGFWFIVIVVDFVDFRCLRLCLTVGLVQDIADYYFALFSLLLVCFDGFVVVVLLVSFWTYNCVRSIDWFVC